MKRIAVLFSGEGSNLAYILEHLHNKELSVAVAITNNPEAKGIAHAKKSDVPLAIVDSKTYENREQFDSKIVAIIQKHNVDLTVLAGFMRILTPIFTNSIKSINLHPSLLPRHKGMNAIERSYMDSYPSGGVSVHLVTSELDGGEIIVSREIDKSGLDFEEYHLEVKRVEKIVLSEAIKKVLNSDML